MPQYVVDHIKLEFLTDYLKINSDDLRHSINKTTQQHALANNTQKVINLIALGNTLAKDSLCAIKRKAMMIKAITNINNNPAATPQMYTRLYHLIWPKIFQEGVFASHW